MDRRLLTAVIVDDDPLGVARLSFDLGRIEDFRIVGTADSGAHGLEVIRATRPDLLIAAADMPGITGFEMIRRLGAFAPIAVILVSPLPRHALMAFDAGAVDFVLKPIEFDRLALAVERARDYVRHRQAADRVLELESAISALRADRGAPVESSDTPGLSTHLWLPDGSGHTSIPVDSIEWAEADRDYVRIHTTEKKYFVRRKIGDLAERLDPQKFLRIHRSVLINIQAISRIERMPRAALRITLKSGAVVPVGKSYTSAMRNWMRSRV